ncbi:MAG: UDP-glucose dehydrogenase family protein [Pseudomonadota bacterium]
MKITVIGTGYVGLVTGTCFAEMGHHVTCVDVDAQKIDHLREGILPIYEPGLEPLVARNAEQGRLRFTTSLAEGVPGCEAFFIAVGTPPGEDGSADLQYVLAVAREIGAHLDSYAVVVDKSTVPVGTADRVHATIQAELVRRGVQVGFDVVSNPEFLKEGAAVQDFMKPDRIVVGADSEAAIACMRELYADFSRNHDRLIVMGVRDAEMTKYVANAMLATKISFMNEIANLCDRMGADVENVRVGIGSDQRIGYHFIYPGCGYGGSCFPKDVKALIRMAHAHDFAPAVLQAVEERNETQKSYLFERIRDRYGDNLEGRQFGLWGLAFKPGTDDMREAPSKVLIRQLIEAGASVRAHDPVAMDVARQELPAVWFESGRLALAEDEYAAAEDADALVLVTEWRPFRNPDFERIRAAMRPQPAVFDGRNQYAPESMRALGYHYTGVGRTGA